MQGLGKIGGQLLLLCARPLAPALPLDAPGGTGEKPHPPGYLHSISSERLPTAATQKGNQHHGERTGDAVRMSDVRGSCAVPGQELGWSAELPEHPQRGEAWSLPPGSSRPLFQSRGNEKTTTTAIIITKPNARSNHLQSLSEAVVPVSFISICFSMDVSIFQNHSVPVVEKSDLSSH